MWPPTDIGAEVVGADQKDPAKENGDANRQCRNSDDRDGTQRREDERRSALYPADHATVVGIELADGGKTVGTGEVPIAQRGADGIHLEPIVEYGNQVLRGPLFDLDGRVIGIHSSIGGKVEQNLHVPADAFHKHWDALKAGRLWGSLNNTMRYDPRLADDPLARAVLGAKLDRDSVGGVRVVACPPEMPAAMAGLKPGDIILSAGGTATSGYSDLAGVLAEAAPEQAVALQVRRQGKETTIQVKLADREALASR